MRSHPSQNDPRTDEQLIAALNSGDADAFEPLYYRYRDWVAGLAMRFAHHHEDALDVTQEAFAYLVRKFPGFRLTARMTTFLYPVVKHLALAARKKRGSAVTDENALSNAAAPAPQPRDEISDVLANLPDAMREVLLMRFVDDLTLDEIAAALNIPLGTVKSRLHNALQRLREDPRARRYF